MSSPLAVSLDLDGTLAKTGPLKVRLWREFLREPAILGAYERAIADLRSHRSADLHADVSAIVAERTGRDPADVARVLSEVIGTVWPATFRHAKVPAAIRDLLGACADARIPVAIVSDHPPLGKLDAMGLTSSFAVHVDATRLGALKPFPDALLAAAAALGVPVGAVVHVGDRWDTDGCMAAAVGARFVLAEDSALRDFASEVRKNSIVTTR